MPGHTRGALPLAVLIAATLLTGIVLAVIRATEEGPPVAVPTTEISPTESPTPVEPTDSPTPEPTESPTIEPTESPTTQATESPTTEPTESPTTEPTESPTIEPTESPTGKPRNGDGDRDVLADTGGPPAPFLISGAMLIGLAGALWRFSRRPID